MILGYATYMIMKGKGSANAFGMILIGSIDYFFIYAIVKVIVNGGCS